MWSLEFQDNRRIFQKQKVIDLSSWTQSYQWAKSDKIVAMEDGEDVDSFFCPAREATSVLMTDISDVRNMRYNTFAQYQK